VPLVPVIVTVYVPARVELLVTMTSLDTFAPVERSKRLGREDKTRPLGDTAVVKLIVPENPARLVTVTFVKLV
jgi:hypothetical protein